MTRNLSLFFAAIFVLTTALDIWTTWVGIYQFGYYELNPLTDTSSIHAMAIPEVITLFIGVAMVAAGAHFCKTLRPLPDERFASFYKRYFAVEKFYRIIVLFPMLFVVVRMAVVLSNTSLIFLDWGLFGQDSRWFNYIVMCILFFILMRPTTYFIYLVCRASKP